MVRELFRAGCGMGEKCFRLSFHKNIGIKLLKLIPPAGAEARTDSDSLHPAGIPAFSPDVCWNVWPQLSSVARDQTSSAPGAFGEPRRTQLELIHIGTRFCGLNYV